MNGLSTTTSLEEIATKPRVKKNDLSIRVAIDNHDFGENPSADIIISFFNSIDHLDEKQEKFARRKFGELKSITSTSITGILMLAKRTRYVDRPSQEDVRKNLDKAKENRKNREPVTFNS